MFNDYKDLVVKSYREKLAARDLSNNLADPTPAKLRDQCLLVYTSRYDKQRDSKTLQAFFGQPDEHGNYGPVIKNFEVSRFKPLAQFLRDMNRKPNTLNIELLAWLIDYHTRPYKFDAPAKQYEHPGPVQNQDQEQKPEQEQELPPQLQPEVPEAPGSPTGPPPPRTPEAPKLTWKERMNKHQKKTALLLLLLGFIAFILMKLPNDEQCMYWAGDRYKAIDCDKRLFGIQSIAMDTFKLNHFKKITRPDTMTAYSIGRVWCVQIGRTPQCFTTDGNHPLHPERELKKLSLTLLRKYFGAKPADSITAQR